MVQSNEVRVRSHEKWVWLTLGADSSAFLTDATVAREIEALWTHLHTHTFELVQVIWGQG